MAAIFLQIDHMKEYLESGHPYISDYSLNPALTWVLTTSPMMTEVLGHAEFVEIDATFKSSIELEYLLNVVCFDYNSLLCKSSPSSCGS
jgi:hypothetical protein